MADLGLFDQVVALPEVETLDEGGGLGDRDPVDYGANYQGRPGGEHDGGDDGANAIEEVSLH
ncbi:MAG: hypothetical protein M3124_04220 [Actinomycetota bacterium]|nr:hypothetical protein [Actinomycetota bacterium]